MKTNGGRSCGIAAAAFAAFAAVMPGRLDAEHTTAQAIHIGDSDLGGAVTEERTEAGVWVIADNDLATKFAKIVVTDDRGRYLIPDLPKANYGVWVRGYGLVDFCEGENRSRQDCRPEGHTGAEPGSGGAILSGCLPGIRCWKFQTRACFPAPAPTATATACRSS